MCDHCEGITNSNHLDVLEMDADFSHDPKDLKLLRNTCKSEKQDLVVGSRYLNGVNVVNWPMKRVLLSVVP